MAIINGQIISIAPDVESIPITSTPGEDVDVWIDPMEEGTGDDYATVSDVNTAKSEAIASANGYTDGQIAVVNEALATKSGKSTAVAATLSAANWTGTEAPFAYTLTLNGVTTTSNQEILPAVNITAEQLEALQGANIQDGGQSAGSVTLKAFGDVPTIDIPIRVIVRGDM